jgi:CRP-like cAMP-binding protein
MESAATRQHVAESDLFRGLASDQIDFLARQARPRTLKAGEVLFSFGNIADRFYLVIAGEITVEVPALEGPALELQHLGPGAVVGWSWLIAPRKWNFQARARSAASLLEFDGDAVLAECERNPQFGYEILKRFSALMSERLNAARQRIMDAWRAEGFA